MIVARVALVVMCLQHVARFEIGPLIVRHISGFAPRRSAISVIAREHESSHLSSQGVIIIEVVVRPIARRHDTRYALHIGAASHHDVQNGINAFCILTGTWVGNHFDTLYHRSGHRFQHLLGVFRQSGIIVSVFVNLKVAVALHTDVILTVHSHHWNLAKHIHHSQRLRFLIALHVVGYTVYLLLDELFLCFDDNTIQFFAPCDGVVAYTS